MEKTLGVVWEWNQRDALLCSWVMLRAEPRLPRDIRRYMKRYLYDPICAATPIFKRLGPWSDNQFTLYHTALTNPMCVRLCSIDTATDASRALCGIAVAFALCGKNVWVVTDRQLGLLFLRDQIGVHLRYEDVPGAAVTITSIYKNRYFKLSNGGSVDCCLVTARMYTEPDCILLDKCGSDFQYCNSAGVPLLAIAVPREKVD
jgi:hypothetical protein